MFLRELYSLLTSKENELFFFFSGYLFEDREELEKEFGSESYYFDDHKYYSRIKYHKIYQFRKVLKNVKKITEKISPDIIVTFSDNPYIYQGVLKKWITRSKIVLMHEGSGDYSENKIPFKNILGILTWKILLWPHYFKIAYRSYTGLYNNACIYFPELIKREFPLNKYKLPSVYFRNVFMKRCSFDISPNSIMICFTGHSWFTGIKMQYFTRVLNTLDQLNRSIYLKLAPSQNQSDYFELLTGLRNTTLISDKHNTAESYCLHENIDIIVSDLSSAVINAIFSGMRKEIYFLCKEIHSLNIQHINKNDLIDYLEKKEIITQINIDDIAYYIGKNINKMYNYSEDNNMKYLDAFRR